MIVSRWFTYLNALLYTFLGALLFFFSAQLAPVFAWKVTPFMTMTIGGWCLGNAWLAWLAARRWHWGLVYTALFYLWLFGALETAVVLAFSDKLQLAHPIAWLYLLTLSVNVVAALVGIVEWVRTRPARASATSAPSRLMRFLVAAFILLVGFLGYYGLTAQIGAPGTNAEIFPEVMSLFTLRSFGAFYFTLAVSVIPLLWERNRQTALSHALLLFGLILFITIAALAYLPLFNFAAHRFQSVYFGIYVLVGSVIIALLLKYGSGAPRDAAMMAKSEHV